MSGAIGIAVIVALFSAKQNSLLSNIGLSKATAAGSSFVFKISLGLAVINIVLSLFIKKT
ncbi:hypothetical protein [Metasolibacillus sp. FSL K6-0083]|uniref:hypothetical protein n=1 Tax=Metasolibacillus sp. FSL K6-0083 TaxID=2921416 RepID=UPI0031599A12